MKRNDDFWFGFILGVLVLAIGQKAVGADWRQDRRDLRRNHRDEWRLAKGAAEATADLYDLNRRERSQQRVQYAMQEVETTDRMPAERDVWRWLDCPEDHDGDHRVGSTDIEIVLANWGPPPDGTDVSDLLAVLGKWGPCPYEEPPLRSMTGIVPRDAEWDGNRSVIYNSESDPRAVVAGHYKVAMGVGNVTRVPRYIEPPDPDAGAILLNQDGDVVYEPVDPPQDGPLVLVFRPDGRALHPETGELVPESAYEVLDVPAPLP